MSSTSYPQLIFGTASFGDAFREPQDVQSVLDLLRTHHIMRLDTAARYPPTKHGRSEELLGEVNAAQQGFTLDTKILATAPDPSGEMTREKIEESVSASLHRLRTDKLGISNFKPEILAAYLAVCDEHDYIKPSVYQGNYSMINRGAEKHIFPILRKHGIAFSAYGSLAAGFLSGSVTSGSKEGTRFGGDGYMSQYFHRVYDHEPLHNAQRKLATSADELGITPIEAALRWVMYHSALQEGDGIILGASRKSQVMTNIKSISNGPLPNKIVADIQAVWDELRTEREDNYIF
ncbi:hypothetical protein OIDMADRAFT_44817 [Oidiodendron maius Zn]|uniref:NADP-dependent oxidoreductase domain-containing protein n=1 Tax=Oidiodendron maius (strain Zn) TaxID=913774 RepID=A0A0C3D2A8_OIDMZ|nr:hypothetical protein OIDMADRAFT_44817 [Oidiodendron maius Zn]